MSFAQGWTWLSVSFPLHVWHVAVQGLSERARAEEAAWVCATKGASSGSAGTSGDR